MFKSVLAPIIILTSSIVAAVLLFIPTIPQIPGFHEFADQRKIFAIPHFFNVVTNLPFLVLGYKGMRQTLYEPLSGGMPELRRVYGTFFTGILLVGLGSSYYHLQPTNETLVWDRLPLTIAFMAFFAIVVGENIAAEIADRLLYPLVITGMLSVVYWYWGEQRGQGDLRFYALVQFLPLLLSPIILLFGRHRFANNAYVWGLLAAYGAAKLAEYGDDAVYRMSGFISGHSVKHLLSAAGVWLFAVGLKQRVRAD